MAEPNRSKGTSSGISYFLNIGWPFFTKFERLKVGLGHIFQGCIGRKRKDSGLLRKSVDKTGLQRMLATK